MKKAQLQRIIKEELDKVSEAYGRGGRYGGWGTTGYRGRYGENPWYRQGGSGKMSDAEARERGARGYDEPNEPDVPRGPRGGNVHSTVTIYTDPTHSSVGYGGKLGPRLDQAADVFIKGSGYDGMVGNFITGTDPATGYNKVGEKWTLSAASDGGYTFKAGGVIGSGATPSEALTDAAQQGFPGSDSVLMQLGVERDEFFADPGQAEHERVPGGNMDTGDDLPEDLDESAEEEAVMDEGDPGDDLGYDDYIQQQHGRYSYDYERSTPEFQRRNAPHGSPTPAPSYGGAGGHASRRSEWGDPDLFGGPPRVDESTRRVVGRWNKLAGTLKD